VRSAPYTSRRGARVSWLSLKTKVDDLSMVWPQNHWDGLSVVWPQNHKDSFSRFGIKPGGFGFPGLDLKTGSYGLVTLVSKSPRRFLVWASKPSGLQFIGSPQNRRDDEDGAGHASRSSGLLRVEASQARVSLSNLKTGGGATASGARGTIAVVA
jgi:hypothetical protein